MMEAKVKKLLALAAKSKKSDFLEVAKDVSGASREALEVVWTAAKLMKKAERMGRLGIW